MRRILCISLTLLLLLLFTGTVMAEDDGHNYGPWITDRQATCTQEGHQKKYCRDCDHWEQRYTKKLPHTIESWEVTKEPTCTEKGVRVAYCTVCGSFLRVEIDKLGHDWVASNAVVPATCNSTGKGDVVCTRCGRTKKDTTIPRLKHQWSEWVVKSEPSGKKKGTKERTCQLCGKTETEKFYYEGTLYEGMEANLTVIQLQVMLWDLGYYTGNISTGKYGAQTGKAVAKFQKANGIKATEVADPPTVIEIRRQWEAMTGRNMYSITEEEGQQKKKK